MLRTSMTLVAAGLGIALGLDSIITDRPVFATGFLAAGLFCFVSGLLDVRALSRDARVNAENEEHIMHLMDLANSNARDSTTYFRALCDVRDALAKQNAAGAQMLVRDALINVRGSNDNATALEAKAS